MRCCGRYRGVPALSKKDPLDAAMFMIKEIGVAPVPGDGFYREGTFGDECVLTLPLAPAETKRSCEDFGHLHLK